MVSTPATSSSPSSSASTTQSRAVTPKSLRSRPPSRLRLAATCLFSSATASWSTSYSVPWKPMNARSPVEVRLALKLWFWAWTVMSQSTLGISASPRRVVRSGEVDLDRVLELVDPVELDLDVELDVGGADRALEGLVEEVGDGLLVILATPRQERARQQGGQEQEGGPSKRSEHGGQATRSVRIVPQLHPI